MAASLATNPSVRGHRAARSLARVAACVPGLARALDRHPPRSGADLGAGFGQASLARAEPATPDTLYRIASITKLFTSTAILQLRDAGKLRLSDPLTEYLPWFRIGVPTPTRR